MLTEGSTSPTALVEQAQTEDQPIPGSGRAQGHRRGRRRHLARSRRQRLAAVFVLLAAASAHSVVVWPGRMSNDTLTQISLVRAGTYTDWHASLLLVLWRPFWLLGVGPGWVTWASTVTFLFGLYALLRGVWPRALSVVVALAICAFPPVLGHIGYLGRDLWYTALFLVAAAAMLRLARAPTRRWRVAYLALTGLSVWLLVASRQNALPVAGVLFLGVVTSCGPWARLGRFDCSSGADGHRLRGRVVRVGIAASALVMLMVAQSLVRGAFGVQATHPEQATYIYDLAALSVREHQVLFSPGIFPAQDLAVLEKNWSPTVVNTLLFGEQAPIPFPVPRDQVTTLRNDWIDAIGSHPRGYLKIRWKLWESQMAWKGKTEWIYHPFVDPNPWGYEVAHPALDEPLQSYLKSTASDPGLHGGPLYEVWVYLAFTALGLVYLRHRAANRQLLGWFCLASLVYQATIFVGAMGIGYRLAYPSVVLAVAVAAIGTGDLVRTAVRRSQEASAPDQLPAQGA